MFCVNCGKEINDNQKFCRYCGVKNEIDNNLTSSNSEILNNTQSQQINTLFNRDVLNNYLYNVRALEIMNNKLIQKKNNILYKINQLGFKNEPYAPGGYGEEFFFTILIMGGISLAAWLIGSLLEKTIGKITSEAFFHDLYVFVIIATLVIGTGVIIYYIVSTVKDKKDYQLQLINDKERVEKELVQKELLNSQLPSLQNEIDKIEALLLDAYSINIIPSKFRNIYAAYFLYDFISTSTASLNEALLHCDLDTIQQKLDEVIQQQESMIMELAYQNALNEKIVRQNEQILGHAIQTENNAALAAQYTKIAANNTGVVAAIQMSEYLRP